MPTLGIFLMGAGLLVAGGVLKALRPADTARAIAAVLPGTPSRLWPPVVRGLAVVEAAVGAAAVVHPDEVLAVTVAVSYLTFAVWVLWARAHGGALSTCGCFGTPDTPPTVVHAVIDAVVAGGAIGLVISPATGWIPNLLARQYDHGVPLVLAALLAGWLAYLVMSPLARLNALRTHAPPPDPPRMAA